MKFWNWLRRLFSKTKYTGARAQPKDSRDLRYTSHFKVGGAPKREIPSFTLWGKAPDQRNSEACVGFSLNRLLQILIYQETGVIDDFSQLFLWYNARAKQGWEEENTGVYPRDAFKELFRLGYIPYESMPFSGDILRAPTDKNFQLGQMVVQLLLSRNYKYYTMGKNDALTLIQNGQAVAFAVPTCNSMYYTSNGYVKEDDEPLPYLHYLVGEGVFEKDGKVYVKAMNWWGKGYLYIPKAYFMKNSRDLWTLANQ